MKTRGERKKERWWWWWWAEEISETVGINKKGKEMVGGGDFKVSVRELSMRRRRRRGRESLKNW